MPLEKWKKLPESVVSRDPWWTYRKDTYEPSTGNPGEYHHVHTNGSLHAKIGNGGIRDGMAIDAWGIAQWARDLPKLR